jgi:hypothetical protein
MSKKDPWAALGQPRPRFRLKLTPEAVQVMAEWNLKHYGQGTKISDPYVRDPENIERIRSWAMPGETPSDTIIRVLSGPTILH